MHCRPKNTSTQHVNSSGFTALIGLVSKPPYMRCSAIVHQQLNEIIQRMLEFTTLHSGFQCCFAAIF
jgi:hypothetical protein